MKMDEGTLGVRVVGFSCLCWCSATVVLGALQEDGVDDDSGSEGEPLEEGSVADSDAEEHEFEETACTSGGP